MTRAPRAVSATLAAFAFVAPVAWLLATTVPATVQRPLGDDTLGHKSFPVEIPEVAYLRVRGGPSIHRVRLVARKIDALASHMQVRIVVATYGTTPALDRGELSIAGTDCVYRTVRGARFPNNDLLTFVRSTGCTPLTGTPTGELRLTLQFAEPGRVALWADTPPGPVRDEALVVSDRSAGETTGRAVVRGFLVDVYPSKRLPRVTLLAYVWQIAPTPRWIWMAVGASTALLWIGMFLLAAPRIDSLTYRRAVVSRMAGGFCAAGALTLAYAVIVPPFQAADEPNHFVGFAAFIHRAGMEVEAGTWARIGHFERIQFRPDEHFTPADIDAPGIEWNDGTVPEASTRGMAVQWLWRALPSFVRVLPAPKLLLALRLLNALVFSIAVALFFGIVGGLGRAPWPELLAIPIFLVPTLPFFAMTVSNYGLLASAYVVLAAGIVVDFRDRAGAAAAGPVIGAAWMAAALTSRSALPLAAFVAAWLLGRLVVGHRDRAWRPALVYWGGGTAFLVAGLWLANRDYVRTMASMGQLSLPRPIASLVLAIVAWPWLLIVAGLAAAWAQHRLSPRLRQAPGPKVRAVVLKSALGAALVIVIMLAGSIFVQYPMLPWVESARPATPAAYVRSAMAAAVTVFRVARPDFLTSVSFWGGFGWLDTLPPPAFVSVLVTASALAFTALLVSLARAGDVRPLVRMAFALLGYAMSVAAYALSVFLTTPADLHGRYLLGLYLCMLTIGWSVVALLVDGAPARRADAVRAACCAAFVAIHVFSLGVILTRYF